MLLETGLRTLLKVIGAEVPLLKYGEGADKERSFRRALTMFYSMNDFRKLEVQYILLVDCVIPFLETGFDEDALSSATFRAIRQDANRLKTVMMNVNREIIVYRAMLRFLISRKYKKLNSRRRVQAQLADLSKKTGIEPVLIIADLLPILEELKIPLEFYRP